MRKRLMCLSILLLGVPLVRPAAAQQSAPPETSSAPGIQVARTTDDLRERILLDKIDELEKRISDLEARDASAAAPAAPAAAPAPAAEAPKADDPQASGSAAPAPTPAPAAPPTWSVGPIDFSGTLDGYYNLNFNHPSSPFGNGNNNETNILYNFNIPAHQFSLNLAKLGMSHAPDPVGFEFDLGYGEAMTAINSVSSDTGFDKFVEQAYVSFKPAKAKGAELDFGKFVTSAGAEVIESYTNWNYSRSLLFAWAIPYYHFGLRGTVPVGKHWVVGGQLVNGWNSTVDNNTGKTIGVTAMGTYSKASLMIDWYGGPENTGTNQGWRHLLDTTLTLTPMSKIAAYINFDYGRARLFNSFVPDNTLVEYNGIAAAVHFMPTSKWSFTPRYEWFSDHDGFATLGANSAYTDGDPVKQHLQEFTATAEYKFLEGLLWRGEYRYDWSDQPFFVKGMPPCQTPFSLAACPGDFGLGNSKNQSTITFAMVAYFGPKR